MTPSAEATGPAIGATGGGPSAIVLDVATRARPFDLRRQETLERSGLRRLEPMLETVAHRIGGSLSSSLRQPVRVELLGLDQSAWEDYAQSLPEPTFVSSAVLLPLEGRAVLHLPVELTLVILDFYLGGDGINQPEREQLTDIERTLAGGLLEGLWNQIPQPFSSFAALTAAMVTTNNSAMLVQVGQPGTLCLIVRMQITLGDLEPFDLELTLTANVVRNLIDQLERHQDTGSMGGLNRQEARRRLLTVPVELKVAYPPIGLTPAELLELQVGDVVHVGQIDHREPQELELTLGEVAFGTGMLVENGKRLACTVLTRKETDE